MIRYPSGKEANLALLSQLRFTPYLHQLMRYFQMFFLPTFFFFFAHSRIRSLAFSLSLSLYFLCNSQRNKFTCTILYINSIFGPFIPKYSKKRQVLYFPSCPERFCVLSTAPAAKCHTAIHFLDYPSQDSSTEFQTSTSPEMESNRCNQTQTLR